MRNKTPMKKQFGTKRELKRHRRPGNNGPDKYAKKDCHIEETAAPGTSLVSSGDFSDGEHAPGEVVQNESSMYDVLLTTLESCNKAPADVCKKRKRGEGRSDFKEDGGSRSLTSNEEYIGEEGIDSEFSKSHVIESKLQEMTVSMMENNEDDESEDDQDESDTDQELNSGVNPETIISSFHEHFSYNLSEEEINNLSNKKFVYKWDMPAFDMSNCKWEGTGECFLKDDNIKPSYGLKQRLYKHWLDAYKTSGSNDFHSSKQRIFFSLCNSYRDILHCNKKPFYLKGLKEDSSISDAYIMHCLNHIFRTRDLIKKNDSKVTRHQEGAEDKLLAVDGFLDRGFTRPKVLVLLPLRRIAYRVVRRLLQLTPQDYKVNVEHADRFNNEFGEQVDENGDVDELMQSGGNSKPGKSSKPSDFIALFGRNRHEKDDDFMIGIKFTRRSIKLYSDFYSSDMIVASPLNLHHKIDRAILEKKDFDYLSSIEVLVIDHADIISMQNWDFLSDVLEKLNQIPSTQHGTDIMRIRKWYLDGHARYYRQTIILGHYVNPDINASFNHQCLNYQGKVRSLSEHKGVLSKVLVKARQIALVCWTSCSNVKKSRIVRCFVSIKGNMIIYERFDAKSIADVDDARLEYFIKKVFPKIKDSNQGGIMLFTSSYFEYVRLRNYLKSQNASFCAIADYTEQGDTSRARVWFFEGRKKMMLYTERKHFYSRYKIRGVQNLIIYSLPERKEYYPEVVNMLEGAHNMLCTVLFSQVDMLRLKRIVGSENAKRMITSEKNVFLFH